VGCFTGGFLCLSFGAWPGGKSGTMGRFGGGVGGPGCLGMVEMGEGGGIISLEGGSWKVRFSTARPPLRDCRWKAAGRPCCQKLAAWFSWCWTKW
jgi:hypothetical protein